MLTAQLKHRFKAFVFPLLKAQSAAVQLYAISFWIHKYFIGCQNVAIFLLWFAGFFIQLKRFTNGVEKRRTHFISLMQYFRHDTVSNVLDTVDPIDS